MKILIDTNILISAILFPRSKPAQVLLQVSAFHDMVLCEQNIYELFEVIKRKAPHMLPAAKDFLTELSFEFIPNAELPTNSHIRDVKDQPILDAAVAADVDIIITGDKDFLTLDIDKPICITAAQFLERIRP